jgi:hypothetical protein
MENIMAVTAQLEQFPSVSGSSTSSAKGAFANLLARITIAAEARAIFRMEREFAHLLSAQDMVRIKHDFAKRKAEAGL